ncbi:Hsp70 family protein [Streptomyces sp. NBC_01381]|uniref:Hsp70 family protein n=1 Tax=unclassified Streptomyces TaxID=2593676 RepID=UPI00224CFE4E|nr:Hsp70 family protein [Streptomyces sp. NBC_01381]MCX4669179.1 Hsp70 family protein [Streptomyces sp. NBC_01381]
MSGAAPGPVHGIDFGTSTSALLIGRPDGTVTGVKDPAAPHAGLSIRTAVCPTPRGELAVGQAAFAIRMANPVEYHAEFKRHFGESVPLLVAGRARQPHELTGEMLSFLRSCGLKQVPEEPRAVVITVPASWEAGNRELMLEVAEAAGYQRSTVRLVTEPVAALAHAFAEHRPEDRHCFLVYDLGGGTFDVAVARSAGAEFELAGAPGGLADVGGGAFDREILRWLSTRFPEVVRTALEAPAQNGYALLERLQMLSQCQTLKHQLSVVNDHTEYFAADGGFVPVTMDSGELAELLGPFLERTLTECERTLAAAGLGWADVDAVVPVGGSSRLRAVGGALSDRSRRTVRLLPDPDLAVAGGAVLLARRVLAEGELPPGLAPGDPVARQLRAGLNHDLIALVRRQAR